MTDRHRELEEKWKNSNRKEKKKWTKDINPPVIIKKGTTNLVTNVNREKKLDVVIVSVNYNDFLTVSLQHNIEIFNNITVVTSDQDILCQKICEKFGVKCVVTNSMYDDESEFKKGKAINFGINSLENPDFILLLDADIIVRGNIDLDKLNEEYLYTSSRYICKSYNQLNDVISNGKILDEELIHEGDKGIGFFQLFNINNKSIDKNSVYPETSTDASWDDLVFRDKFPKRQIIDNNIIHLGDPYTNWKGRKSNRFLKDEEIVSILTKKPTFTICTYYFDFNDNPKQKQNIKKFINQFKDFSENLIIAVPEDIKFNLKTDCKIVKIPGINSGLWSKEILINKIVGQIETDYFIWIDNDIIYNSLDWLNNLDTLFRKKDFVQLFSKINYLDESGKITDSFESILSSKSTDVDNLLKLGYKPGGSWLAKTNIIKSKPLFEKMYVGGGDTVFAYGLFGEKNGWTLNQVKQHNYQIYEEAQDWINNFGKFRLGFLEEEVSHLYHGDLKDRNYNTRYSKLSEYLIKEEKTESNITKNIFSDNKKIVVYTCISGNYDSLKEVVNPEYNIDYICFTDQDIKSDTWKVKKIPEFLNYLEQTKRARCLKILPHLFLETYDFSIWIDGNIQVIGEINELVEKNKNHYFSIPKHPDRTCVYEEASAIISLKKDVIDNVKSQVEKYKELGYPENHGLVQSNVIIREHNNKECIRINEGWWSELLFKSKRDQLSFNFSIWQKDYRINIINPSIVSSKNFQIYTHVHKGGNKAKIRGDYDAIKNYINGLEV